MRVDHEQGGRAQRAVERGAYEDAFDGNEALVGDEGNRGAVRPGGVALDHRGVLLAEEAVRRERDAPVGREIQQRTARTRGEPARTMAGRTETHTGTRCRSEGLLFWRTNTPVLRTVHILYGSADPCLLYGLDRATHVFLRNLQYLLRCATLL